MSLHIMETDMDTTILVPDILDTTTDSALVVIATETMVAYTIDWVIRLSASHSYSSHYPYYNTYDSHGYNRHNYGLNYGYGHRRYGLGSFGGILVLAFAAIAYSSVVDVISHRSKQGYGNGVSNRFFRKAQGYGDGYGLGYDGYGDGYRGLGQRGLEYGRDEGYGYGNGNQRYGYGNRNEGYGYANRNERYGYGNRNEGYGYENRNEGYGNGRNGYGTGYGRYGYGSP
ncbi:keratin-associated protein 19-2-like [Uloborus diversus]|uniref:keratin-associated protein 19-2-like n=1 Tax=Uloborus diversus TaxID=327109 RepID=UPI0024092ECB|nr:keratin-associated protein 19-2-like [Uloborus diversus]